MNWIKVEDELPTERYLPVLVFNGDAPEYNQCVTPAYWFSQENRFKRDTPGTFLGTITHWMPLPEPPNQ